MRAAFRFLQIGIASVVLAATLMPTSAQPSFAGSNSTRQIALPLQQSTIQVYLPLVMKRYPWVLPFGVESNLTITTTSVLYTRTLELQPGWIRLNDRISWRRLQASENSPIDWSQLQGFENELRLLRQMGIRPIVVVDDHPLWATRGRLGSDGQPSHCDAIREDKFQAFANFVAQLVRRYKAAEFNVRDWELGNEPDVDPSLVPSNSAFGCWGDISDPYYGGEGYGRMLRAVAPAIRREDPGARIWIGGLLLSSPGIDEGPSRGSPGKFLEGVLRAGAADSFDVVAFHAYLPYAERDGQPILLDYDYAFGTAPSVSWSSLNAESFVAAKAKYLREVMSRYGVSKPLSLNEIALMCPNDSFQSREYCINPTNNFFDMKASALVHFAVRSLASGVESFIWYTINGPGWRNAGLLDGTQSPRPAFLAYKTLSAHLYDSEFVSKETRSDSLQRYIFRGRHNLLVDVAWSISGTITSTLAISSSKFITATQRDGLPLAPMREDGVNKYFDVGLSPVYIVRRP